MYASYLYANLQFIRICVQKRSLVLQTSCQTGVEVHPWQRGVTRFLDHFFRLSAFYRVQAIINDLNQQFVTSPNKLTKLSRRVEFAGSDKQKFEAFKILNLQQCLE
ncbi:Hypothetical_protein [Hexamita inflata]|uniref:Hypothetical_protein n=1 Tax=Hexamita inflata TaxID=28002 RepID=A0AA86RYT6_9EUKA|nr:Hypothetical protein HINF_LOCUS62635 [Hexamita inflata]